MTPEEMKARINELEAELEPLREHQAALMEQILALATEQRELQESYDKTYLPEDGTLTQEQLDYLVEGQGNGMAAHLALEKWFSSFHPMIAYGGWWGQANDYETPRVPQPKVMFTKGADAGPVVEALRKIFAMLPKAEVIDVFEHTLSEGGTFHIEVVDDDTLTLFKTTYGHRDEKKTGTWEEVLDYVSKRHWYRSDDPNDVDDY